MERLWWRVTCPNHASYRPLTVTVQTRLPSAKTREPAGKSVRHVRGGNCSSRGSNPRPHTLVVSPLGHSALILTSYKPLSPVAVDQLSLLVPTHFLQGTVKGGRRQGRQRKRWEDIIREWTGLEFGKSQRAVENREKWRKLVAKSSVVPQRPSRLRN